MAPPKEKRKRRHNRKARTEVSSTSSSDNEFSTPQREQALPADAAEAKSADASLPVNSAEQHDELPTVPSLTKRTDPEQAFDGFYLKQATREFDNDLDKLRSGSDFREGSVAILIDALRQGRACFSSAERARIAAASTPDGIMEPEANPASMET